MHRIRKLVIFIKAPLELFVEDFKLVKILGNINVSVKKFEVLFEAFKVYESSLKDFEVVFEVLHFFEGLYTCKILDNIFKVLLEVFIISKSSFEDFQVVSEVLKF